MQFNSISKFLFVMMCVQILSACFIETSQRDESLTKKKNDPLRLDACKSSVYETEVGCLQISLPSAPSISVGGRSFRDAASFARSLGTLFKVEDSKATDEKNNSQTIIRLQPIENLTNDNWAQEFRLYFKGAKDFNGRVGLAMNGFDVQYLPISSDYRARLQRDIPILITRIRQEVSNDGAPTPDIKPEVTTYKKCLTVFKEFSFEIFASKKTSLQIDSFDVLQPQDECANVANEEPVIRL